MLSWGVFAAVPRPTVHARIDITKLDTITDEWCDECHTLARSTVVAAVEVDGRPWFIQRVRWCDSCGREWA